MQHLESSLMKAIASAPLLYTRYVGELLSLQSVKYTEVFHPKHWECLDVYMTVYLPEK